MRPYIYKATHKETNQFYIGFRFANKVIADEDIGKVYFTSSETVHALGVENFSWEVIAEFDKVENAYYFENFYIKDVIKNPQCLNKHFIDVETNDNFPKFIRTNHNLSEETRRKSSASHTQARLIPKRQKHYKRKKLRRFGQTQNVEQK